MGKGIYQAVSFHQLLLLLLKLLVQRLYRSHQRVVLKFFFNVLVTKLSPMS